MSIRRLVLLMACLVLSSSVEAEGGWRDRQGNLLVDAPDRKAKDGFAAMLVVTPDKDWEQKWNTPPEVVPEFSGASEVGAGGELFILTLLADPRLDAAGMTQVYCDFVVTRPDGSNSVNQLDLPCFVTELRTDPRFVYLSAALLKFVAEPADLRGIWKVDVRITDKMREVVLSLSTSFTLK